MPEPEDDRRIWRTRTRSAGVSVAAELIGRYAELTGRDSSQIDFYIAFAYWRLACIIDGVYGRTVSGAQANKDLDVELLRSRPPVLAALAEEWAHQAVKRRRQELTASRSRISASFPMAAARRVGTCSVGVSTGW